MIGWNIRVPPCTRFNVVQGGCDDSHRGESEGEEGGCVHGMYAPPDLRSGLARVRECDRAAAWQDAVRISYISIAQLSPSHPPCHLMFLTVVMADSTCVVTTDDVESMVFVMVVSTTHGAVWPSAIQVHSHSISITIPVYHDPSLDIPFTDSATQFPQLGKLNFQEAAHRLHSTPATN